MSPLDGGAPDVAERVAASAPAEILTARVWVVWNLEADSNGKLTKVPYQPLCPLFKAIKNDPRTWATFEEATRTFRDRPGEFSGIGANMPTGWTFIDLDKCIDPETGVYDARAVEIMQRVGGYWERSQSGLGLHGLVPFPKPPGDFRTKKDHIEVYDEDGNYAVMTGDVVQETAPKAEGLKWLLQTHMRDRRTLSRKNAPRKHAPETPGAGCAATDDDATTIDGLRKDARVDALWRGDTSAYDHDASRADLALAGFVMRAVGNNVERTENLMRRSGLARDKWDEARPGGTYLSVTIEKAFSESSEQTSEHAAAVEDLNSTYAVVCMGARTLVMAEYPSVEAPGRTDRVFMSDRDFRLRHSNRRVTTENPVTGKPRSVTLADYWLGSPSRRQYNFVTLDPKKPPGGDDVSRVLNLFCGWAVTPKPGPLASWKLAAEHIRDNLCGGSVKLYRWVLAWIAERLRHPEKAAGVALVLLGEEGVGKSFFAVNIVGGFYHPAHFLQVTTGQHFTGRFNAHQRDALLVFADEAFFSGDRSTVGALKGMITETRVMVEAKYADAVSMPNRRGFIIAGNDLSVVPADLTARRFGVLSASNARRLDRRYFASIAEQLESGGREAFMHYLLTEDFSDCDPYTAPVTAALVAQKELNLKPAERFWFDLLSSGQIPVFGRKWADWPTASGPYSDSDSVWIDCGEATQRYVEDLRDTRAHERELRSASTVLGLTARRLFPNCERRRVTFDAKKGATGKEIRRAWVWSLSYLDIARAQFDRWLGRPSDWEGRSP